MTLKSNRLWYVWFAVRSAASFQGRALRWAGLALATAAGFTPSPVVSANCDGLKVARRDCEALLAKIDQIQGCPTRDLEAQPWKSR